MECSQSHFLLPFVIEGFFFKKLEILFEKLWSTLSKVEMEIILNMLEQGRDGMFYQVKSQQRVKPVAPQFICQIKYSPIVYVLGVGI